MNHIEIAKMLKYNSDFFGNIDPKDLSDAADFGEDLTNMWDHTNSRLKESTKSVAEEVNKRIKMPDGFDKRNGSTFTNKDLEYIEHSEKIKSLLGKYGEELSNSIGFISNTDHLSDKWKKGASKYGISTYEIKKGEKIELEKVKTFHSIDTSNKELAHRIVESHGPGITFNGEIINKQKVTTYRYDKDTTPEMEAHVEQSEKHTGNPTTKEKNGAVGTGVTKEHEIHRQESEIPQKSKSVENGGRQSNSDKKKNAINRIKGGASKISVGGKFKALVAVGSAPLIAKEYNEDKDEKGAARAAVEGIATTAALAVAPPLLIAAGAVGGLAYMGGKAAVELGKKAWEIDKQYQRAGTASPFSTARFFETKDTFTMRQAGMAAIGQARGNLENYMIGNEAQFLR